jgi:capsule polysaccharide export protein KpsE/RkpR
MIKRLKSMNRLFIAVVIVPTIISFIYFGFLANDVYSSEARFVVRSPNKSQG